MYDDLHGTFDGLVLPRAEILKNAFVLWPLSLLAPELVHPGQARAWPGCGRRHRLTRYWPRSPSSGVGCS